MAYTPTNWQTGDVITAQKLNHAEQGIYDASPIVITGSEWVDDTASTAHSTLCTVAELDGYLTAGHNVVFILPSNVSFTEFDGATVRLMGIDAYGEITVYPYPSTDINEVEISISGGNIIASLAAIPQ